MSKYFNEDPDYTEISKKDYDVRCGIVAILDEYKKNMENYGYFGENLGAAEDDFEDIAEDIMNKFKLK